MWFSSRSQPNDSDRFRVSSFRNRIRPKKTAPKCPAEVATVGSGASATVASAAAAAADCKETIPICLGKPAIAALGTCYALQPPGRNAAATFCPHCDDIDGDTKEKNKTLRSDQKYKKNRITKSSSRQKVHDLKTEKQIPCKNVINNNSQRKMSIPLLDVPPSVTVAVAVKKTPNRRNGTLNLNALLRYKSFISGSTKKLTSDDFDRLRRKSLGDTNAVRRKSNPDTNKKKPSGGGGGGKKSKNHLLLPPDAYDTYSSTEDFHSCNEDDHSEDNVDHKSSNECDNECETKQNHTSKSIKASPRTKRNKKGSYHQENYINI